MTRVGTAWAAYKALIVEWKIALLPMKLKLKFEAVKQMTPDEQKSVRDILDAMILKHQARQLIGG